MAYNLYQVQMARAWAERIEKENAVAEKFWADQTAKHTATSPKGLGDGASVASSTAPSGYTSKTSYLKDKLAILERELMYEREQRRRVESDLLTVRTGLLPSMPDTPTGQRY